MAEFRNSDVSVTNLTITGNLSISSLEGFENSSWDTIVRCVRAGKGAEYYPVGSKKRGNLGGHPCTYVVLDHSSANREMIVWILMDTPITCAWSNTSGDYYPQYGSPNCIPYNSVSPWMQWFTGADDQSPKSEYVALKEIKVDSSGHSGENVSTIKTKIAIPSYWDVNYYRELSTNSVTVMQSSLIDGNSYLFFATGGTKVGYSWWTRSHGIGSSTISFVDEAGILDSSIVGPNFERALCPIFTIA